jgi:two-component system response regulator FixJ
MSARTSETQCVFIADDDDGLRDSLAALFESIQRKTRLFTSGDDLLSGLAGGERGCVLLDYTMPGRDGLETLQELKRREVAMPVIMMTAHGDVSLAVSAMKAGALDFIEKPWAKDEMFNLVELALRLDLDKRVENEARDRAREMIDSFTPRELQVFDELIKGASNKVIARTLNLSPRTVEFYRSNVLEKSGSTSIAALVRLAYAAGRVAV